MKALLLDGYGTLVRITEPRHPFRQLGGDNKGARRAFYQRALSEDVDPMDLLVGIGMNADQVVPVLMSLEAEVESIQAFDEAPAFLDHLDHLKIPWLVVSNLATPYCRPLLKALGIPHLKCRFSCETGLLKPEPAAMLSACEWLGVDPSDVMMVGDSLRDDVAGAKAAGLQHFHLDRTRHTLWDVPLPQFSGRNP